MSQVKSVRTAPTADCIVPEGTSYDLDAPELYLNRELTWLNFNWRVLEEAKDKRNPLLERWRYLIIVGSNLDEFTMKRIGGLQLQHASAPNSKTVDGRSPLEQIYECNIETEHMRFHWRELFDGLNSELHKNDIGLKHHHQLSKQQKRWMRDYYLENVFPMVTPQATGPAHSFPFVSNLSTNLLVTVITSGELSYVRIKAPVSSEVPSILQIGSSNFFVPIEEVMAANLDLIFPDHQIARCDSFRVIRNANTSIESDDTQDLISIIESELRDRQFAEAVQLEVNRDMPSKLRQRLIRELNLVDRSSVIEVASPLFRQDFVRLHDCYAPQLKFKEHQPATPKTIPGSVIDSIREHGSLLVHHPYDSFEATVLAFLKEASRDPKVKAIKMSLYRTDRKSRIVRYLAEAARNGKQVAVAVELKARFDEAANIRWARWLEREGIHVTYGVVGLKTHCKAILVVRMDRDRLRRYVHFGTGNYHSVTANQYSDLGFFTCDEDLGADATQLFNYLTTGIRSQQGYKKLMTSPNQAKNGLIEKIRREASLHTQDAPGLIEIKTNAVEDPDLVRALYGASQHGVKVNLLVRDTCRVRPGIKGLSETIRVVSIIGRFLEHARVYHFGNAGNDEYFIGSTDAMKRNLESRVETLVPVETPKLRNMLQELIDLQLMDRRGAWHMQSDGSYIREMAAGADKSRSSQRLLAKLSKKRSLEAMIS